MRFRRQHNPQGAVEVEYSMRKQWEDRYKRYGYQDASNLLSEIRTATQKDRNVRLAFGAAIAFSAIGNGPGLLAMGLSVGAGVLLCLGNDSRRLVHKFNQLEQDFQGQYCPYKMETVDNSAAQPRPAQQALTR